MQFRNRRKRRGVTEVNLTPLIDIVFQLLIFFLITTTFVQNPGIEVQLPKASSKPVVTEAENVIIGVTKEGLFVQDGKALAIDELRERLVSHLKQRPNAMLVVQADTNTPHGKVVEVMDVARDVGFKQLAIATEAQ
ncbi:MAG: biopolymer transporter ExbD [Myxococcota bacterium]